MKSSILSAIIAAILSIFGVHQQVAPASAVAAVATASAPIHALVETPIATTTPVTNIATTTTITQIIEKQPIIQTISIKGFVTKAELGRSLASFKNSLVLIPNTTSIYGASTDSNTIQQQITALQREIAQTNQINNLSNVTLTSPNIIAPTLTGLSTSQISESSNLYYTDNRVGIYINSSSTIPNAAGTFGDVLSWNGSRWTSTATSSLGISGSSYTFSYPFLNTANTISLGFGTTTANTWSSLQTHTIGFLSQASSTVVGNFTATGFYNTSGTTGGYKIDNTLVLQASSTNFSTILGQLAAPSLTAAATGNTAIGYQALNSATSSINSTALGYQALWGAGTVVSGAQQNTAIGYQAMRLNTSGSVNVAVGDAALKSNTIGSNNTAIGSSALTANTFGGQNVALGQLALSSNTTGSSNTALGRQALSANISGTNNIAIGYQTLLSATSSDFLVAIGSGALQNNTIVGLYNTAVGHNAGNAVTNGFNNSLFGYQSGLSLTTGQSNTMLGVGAGKFATSSYENTLIGALTGQNISQAGGSSFGQGETFVGYNAGNAVTTGTFNTLIGHQAGHILTTGGSNVGVGRAVFNALTLGGYNTGIGHAAGFYVTTGGSNTCLGNSACSNPLTFGAGIQTGSYNIGIGEYAGATGDFTNTTAIGSYAAAGANNVMILGSSSSTYAVNIGIGTSTPTTALQVNGVVTPNADNVSTLGNSTYRWSAVYAANGAIQTSDARLKENIATSSYGLDQLLQLQPVSFTWKAHPEQGTKLGFIAQQVQAIIPEVVTIGDDAMHTLGLTYTELIPAIVRSIQQLAKEVADLATTVANFAAVFHTHELCVGDTCVTPEQFKAIVAAAGQSAASPAAPASSAVGESTTPPVIQINGDNPAYINIGDSYADLGAAITAPDADKAHGILTYLNGVRQPQIIIDTSMAATDTIDYVVTGQFGITATATRTVIIQSATTVIPNI